MNGACTVSLRNFNSYYVEILLLNGQCMWGHAEYKLSPLTIFNGQMTAKCGVTHVELHIKHKLECGFVFGQCDKFISESRDNIEDTS